MPYYMTTPRKCSKIQLFGLTYLLLNFRANEIIIQSQKPSIKGSKSPLYNLNNNIPPQKCLKINVDAFLSAGNPGCGIVISIIDLQRKLIYGKSKFMPHLQDVVVAEILVFQDALSAAISNGFQISVIETNSKILARTIHNPISAPTKVKFIIKDIIIKFSTLNNPNVFFF